MDITATIDPDREPEDPDGDDDENAPGAVFNDFTWTVYHEGENYDDDD